MLAILAHDDTCSVVLVNGVTDTGKVWVSFGEVTPKGFNPCYAAIQVEWKDLHIQYLG